MEADDFVESAYLELSAKRKLRRRYFYIHLSIYVVTNAFIYTIWYLTTKSFPWYVFPLFGWGIVLVAHAGIVFLLSSPQEIILKREKKRLRA